MTDVKPNSHKYKNEEKVVEKKPKTENDRGYYF